MDNLDINPETTNFDFEASQRITIKFVGGTHTTSRKSNNHCTVTVPFTSFSHKLRSIQRSGGKITHVSISRLQLVSPNLAPNEPKLVELETVAEKVVVPILEIAPELEIHAQDTVESVAEIIPEANISQNFPELIVAAILPTSTVSQVSQSTIKDESHLAEPVVKQKKQPTSTKTKRDFSEKAASTVQQQVPVAEIVTTPEPVAETKIKAKRSKTSTKTSSKQVIEPVSESVAIAEIVIAPEPVIEVVPEPVAPVPLAEPKKPKTSTRAKSGSGFNKTKN